MSELMLLKPQTRSKTGKPCCRQCGKTLPLAYRREDGTEARGRLGLGMFCTERCGALWADAIARTIETEGVVLGPKTLPVDVQRQVNALLGSM